jgi:hypothetical protein
MPQAGMNGAFGPQTAPRNRSSLHYLATKSPFYELFWMVEEICPAPWTVVLGLKGLYSLGLGINLVQYTDQKRSKNAPSC